MKTIIIYSNRSFSTASTRARCWCPPLWRRGRPPSAGRSLRWRATRWLNSFLDGKQHGFWKHVFWFLHKLCFSPPHPRHPPQITFCFSSSSYAPLMRTVLLLASLLCGPKYSNFFTFLLLIFLQFIYFKQTQAHFLQFLKFAFLSLLPSRLRGRITKWQRLSWRR